MLFNRLPFLIENREQRKSKAIRRFTNTRARPLQPEDIEIDPYGNTYNIYPEQQGILRWKYADSDTILFTPEFYAIHILTSGYDESHDGIEEIGVIHYRGENIIDKFWMRIDPFTSARIKSEKLATNQLARYLDETVPVVAINAGFDFSFLQLAYSRGQRCTNMKCIDILPLSYDLWPSNHTRTLNDLKNMLHIHSDTQPYRALNDAFAIANIYFLARNELWKKMKNDMQLAKKYSHPKTLTRLVEPESFYLVRRGTVLDNIKKEREAIDYYRRAIGDDPSYLAETERYAILLRRNQGVEEELPVVQNALTYAKKIKDKYYTDVFQHRLEYIEKRIK